MGVRSVVILGGLATAIAVVAAPHLVARFGPAMGLPQPDPVEAAPMNGRAEPIRGPFDEDAMAEPPRERSGSGRSDRRLPKDCRLPAAPAGAEVVIFGAYAADAASTAVLAGRAAGVVDVFIEPGERPLYILLSAHSDMIWRIRGATERVAQAVLVASPSAVRVETPREGSDPARMIARPPPRSIWLAGVVGLPRENVTTVPEEVCYDAFNLPGSAGANYAARVVEAALGQKVDVVAGSYELAAVRLPSATASRGGARGPALPASARYFGSWPGGLVEVDPAAVVSAVPVRRARLMPGRFGLQQLEASRAIVTGKGGIWVQRPIERLPDHLEAFARINLAPGATAPKGVSATDCVRRQLVPGFRFTVYESGLCNHGRSRGRSVIPFLRRP